MVAKYSLGKSGDGTYVLWFGSTKKATGLRTGVDIYEELRSLLAEIDSGLDEVSGEEVAERLSKFSPELASQFLGAPAELERRDEEKAKNENLRRAAILSDYRERIDRYVLRESDAPLRRPGGGRFPSRRIG